MIPSELEFAMRQDRPEPPPGLRDRVLAAAMAVERPTPWWALCRTWAAAATVMLAVNATVMRSADPSAPPLARSLTIDDNCRTALPGFPAQPIAWCKTPTLRDYYKDFQP